MGLFDSVIRLSLPLLPKMVVWGVARRYVAGSDLSDAIERIRALGAQGFGTIIDVLGESITKPEQAEEAAREYEMAMDALAGVDDRCAISVKPTHLGLSLDLDLCERLLSRLCVQAAAAGRLLRFEMEDSPTVSDTLAVFSKLRQKHSNLSIVLQARLFRTADDIARLLAEGPGLDVRLVKGIYIEPADVAHTDGAAITQSYIELAEQLVAGGARVAFATHDSALADTCVEIANGAGWVTGPALERPYEFQLLMGVRAQEAQRLKKAGHRVRVYVPYGKDWYAYSMRRLAGNPEVARHVMRAMLSRS
ncbi:MAG: proline dehydrogenase [Pseudohongiellaceae bacterium]|jgi:proline dehydrogenase